MIKLDLKARDFIRFSLGMIVTVTLCYLLYRSLNWAEIKKVFVTANWGWLCLAFLAIAVSYGARGLRWALILVLVQAPGSLLRDAGRLFVGNLLNNVLPFRLGDVYRVAADRKSPVLYLKAGVGILIEKIMDLGLVLLMGAAALLLAPQMMGKLLPPAVLKLVLSRQVWLALLALGIVAVLLMILFRKPILALVHRFLPKLETAERQLSSPRLVSAIVGLGVCGWAFEATAYALCLAAFGVSAPLSLSFLLTASIALSTILPSSPGYIGVYHYTVVLVAGPWAGAIGAANLSVALHAMIWGSINILGILVALALQKGRSAPRHLAQEVQPS